jgi:hypothetical protein
MMKNIPTEYMPPCSLKIWSLTSVEKKMYVKVYIYRFDVITGIHTYILRLASFLDCR